MAYGLVSESVSPTPMWRTSAGKRVRVHGLEGSYAAKLIAATVRDAERILTTLITHFKPATTSTEDIVDIYLVEPIAASMNWSSPREQSKALTLIRVVQPEAPGEPLIRGLTRLLLSHWYGANGAIPLFVLGVGGAVEAQTGMGRKFVDINRELRERLEGGRSVSIFPLLDRASNLSGPISDSDVALATSFVYFVISNASAADLSRFMSSYNVERRDQASLEVFQRPLGTLEEMWTASLQRREIRGSAFGALFRHLGPYIRPFWLREIEVLLYMLVGLSYTLAFPLGFRTLVDDVIPSGNLSALVALSVGLLLAYLINSAILVRRYYVSGTINRTILHDLRAKMYERLLYLPHRFYARAKTGDLMTRTSRDLDQVAEAMGMVTSSGLFSFLTAIVTLAAVLSLNLMLGLLVVLIVPLFAVAYFVLRGRLQKNSAEWQRLMAELSSNEQETISAQTVIKAYTLQMRSLTSYRARLKSTFDVFMRLVVVITMFDAVVGLATALGQLLVVCIGGYLVITGRFTVGTLIAMVALLPSLFEPISKLANISSTVEKASGALDRVDELLEEPLMITDKPDAKALPSIQKNIHFSNVSFGYTADRQVLRDLDLVIPAGKHVSIVGPSGSGKSTTVSLLMRFYDPDQGSVQIDGQDLRDVTIESLRASIGIVFQDTFIFDSSVRDNIAIGRPEAADAEVVAAAKAARLDSFIEMLPNGYDTVLGERGVMMSGGQRQRLAIARALLRDPRILILDEATSALDAQTEREILDTLLDLTRNRTTVSITHRLALAAKADQIVVLDKGHVIEQGPHDQLVGAGGLYQALYEEQINPVGSGGQERVRVSRLKSIPLFAGLDDAALGSIAETLVVEQYAAGTEIVAQDALGDKMYLIASGAVDVLIRQDNDEQLVAHLEEGEYFGEMALLAGEPRSASVRTTERTQLYSLSQADFSHLLEQQPDVQRAITNVVETRKAALDALAATLAADAVSA